MSTRISVIAVGLLMALSVAHAQTSAPVIVQSAAPAAAPVAQAPAPAAAPGNAAALQLLNALKAANAETLKKQEATLIQLDELQKAAEQIKIYTKRG